MARRAAFTLIELVVVIMILGILAGVAAPKFFSASSGANDNGMRQTLSIVRDAIEMYNSKYNALPPLATSGAGADFKSAISEFLRTAVPASSVGAAKNSNITTVASAGTITGDASPTNGYKYNTTTGQFIINSTATSATSSATYDSF